MAEFNGKKLISLKLLGGDFVYKDIGSTNENDIKILVDNISVFEGKIINVLPSPLNPSTAPFACGRRYLLNKNENVHSATAGLRIAVIDPDTGYLVDGDTSHYNKYYVPMNSKEVMRLYIEGKNAIWLNPPFYYAIDADPYLGKNLVAYDDVDWKCKIIRGNGFATIQGVCRVDSGKTLNPNVAGERDIIGAGLPFRPMSHTQGKWCSKFASTSGVADAWVCQADYSDGSLWVKSGSALSGTDDFCVNATFPVWSKND